MNTRKHILSLLALSCVGVAAAAPATPGPAPTADPFAPQNVEAQVRESNLPDEENPNAPKQVSIRFEAFSMEAADAAALLRSGLEGKGLYDRILQKIEKKEATQETVIVLRARSGEKALVEGISEQIYPTEFEPPFVPLTSAPTPAPQKGSAPAAAAPATPAAPAAMYNTPGGPAPACPTSFETRNTGWTLEIEPTIGGDNKVIDLRFAPNYTVKAGVNVAGEGLSRTEMPIFETQRVDTALTLRANVPFFVGTLNRAPMAQVDPQTAKRVWFSFVTGTIVTASCTIVR